MWSYCRKIASIDGLSKRIIHSRIATTTNFIYTRNIPKSYYSDHSCSKEKKIPDELPIVKRISEYFIKPKHEVENSKQPYYLAPHDLMLITFHYIHFGLLFTKPSNENDPDFSIYSFLESLRKSLSLTLVHFYPLAGQLVTEVDEQKHESLVYVDCNKGPGARFIHTTLDINIFDVLSPKYIPSAVESFFDLRHAEAMNYDSRSKPLLSVQVTELLDGIFIACSVNHLIVDGTSYWHFWNTWSEIHMANDENHIICESRHPVYTRWLPDGCAAGPFPIPYIRPDEFVRKFEPPQLRDRVFHISSESTTRLKAIANEQSDAKNISSFQALCALVWRSIVRANRLPRDQVIHNNIAANSRERLDPPLPKYYFGNFAQPLITSTTAGELLENNLGWAASLLHQSVVNYNNKSVCDYTNEWLKSPKFYYHADSLNCSNVIVANSPRFDLYGNEFGLGKAIAFRTGHGNKGIGVVVACPGCKGGGSVDFEICLEPDSMNALESDEEFMAFVSLT